MTHMMSDIESLQQLLQAQLGSAPAAQTTALYERLRRAAG